MWRMSPNAATSPGRLYFCLTTLACFVVLFCLRLEFWDKNRLEINDVRSYAIGSKSKKAETGFSASMRLRGAPVLPAISRTRNPISKPECRNILNNVTVGRWVRKLDVGHYGENERIRLLEEEENITAELFDFWMKRGIQSRLWRPDLRCGYNAPQQRPPSSNWPGVGSWCDKNSERPCCSNVKYGVCSPPEDEKCECPTCVDMRKRIYAEVSEWKVADARCRWHNYSAEEACDLMSASSYNDFYFVGDSLVRNMFGALLMLLRIQ